MKDRRLFLFLTFLPIAMALFFWDLDTDFTSSDSKASSKSTAIETTEQQLPTTILENTRLTQYDVSGQRSQQITGHRLLSSDFHKTIHIELPIIQVETDRGLWIAESQSGQFDQLENRLSLIGAVTLTQKGSREDSHWPVQMQTEQLDYYPDVRLAESTMPVVIESKGHHIESVGVKIDIANSIFSLPENVRSTHAPL